MKKYSKEDIIQRFKESCDIIYRSIETGDYKTGNKEQPKLVRIFKHFEKDIDFALECLMVLIRDESVVASNKAAAWCLALNENVDDAVRVLFANSQKKEAGIFRHDAEMTLRVWKSQGYLLVYEGQEIRRYGPGDGPLNFEPLVF